MAHRSSTLTPDAPFAGLRSASSAAPGVFVSDRDGLGLATVVVRNDKALALAVRMREHFRVELPQGPRRSASGEFALAAIGPTMWLATQERSGNAFAAELREIIGDLAGVSDQSDGYVVLRLSGPKVRDTLCKLVPVDVHSRAFRIGDVASTVAAHIGATLWRLEDGNEGSPVFEIAVFRSLAISFWRALSVGAAGCGLDVERK